MVVTLINNQNNRVITKETISINKVITVVAIVTNNQIRKVEATKVIANLRTTTKMRLMRRSYPHLKRRETTLDQMPSDRKPLKWTLTNARTAVATLIVRPLTSIRVFAIKSFSRNAKSLIVSKKESSPTSTNRYS